MTYFWIESSICEILPSNAVWCSKDKNGLDIFMGQYSHGNSIILAKIIPHKNEAFVAYNGKEIPVLSFKVLASTKTVNIWVRVTNGFIPSNGLICGCDNKNNIYLVGRTFHKGFLIPGYVDPVLKIIHIPYKGKEYQYRDFEILLDTEIDLETLEKNSPIKVTSPCKTPNKIIWNYCQQNTIKTPKTKKTVTFVRELLTPVVKTVAMKAVMGGMLSPAIAGIVDMDTAKKMLTPVVNRISPWKL